MILKIGIDASPLSGNITGIGRYVLEICRLLDQQLPDTLFFLYSRNPIEIKLPSERWINRAEKTWRKFTPSSYIWLKLWVKRMAEIDGIDVFWGTRTILPRKSNSFMTVSTVHDLNYKLFPKTMPFVTLQAHRWWFSRDTHRADMVATNSQGTADRLNKILGVEASVIIRPGVSPEFRSQPPDICKKCLEKFGIKKPYFLAVGTLEPRKNLLTLIKAFLDLKQLGKFTEHDLLLIGNKGWKSSKLYTCLKQVEIKGVRWLGFVSDQELAALYTVTTAFVFPSLYEGFGMPALEARACGAKVVASDIPELYEAAGEEAIYIDPTVEGIQRGLLATIQASPPAPVDIDDWSNAAEKMAMIFRNINLSTKETAGLQNAK